MGYKEVYLPIRRHSPDKDYAVFSCSWVSFASVCGGSFILAWYKAVLINIFNCSDINGCIFDMGGRQFVEKKIITHCLTAGRTLCVYVLADKESNNTIF